MKQAGSYLMARLDLRKYNKPAPLNDEVVDVKKVRIALRQNIGAPAVPVVKAGDVVERGQIIAQPAQGLSVALHASIRGRVREVAGDCIIIDRV